jgi:ABC-type Na+ transport system ATPase subunit NatA
LNDAPLVSDPPTLHAVGARIDLASQPLVAQLNVQSHAQRLGLFGDWSPLFRLLSGEAELSSGKLSIAGAAVPLGVQRGAIGVMRLDALLPAAWSAEHLLTSSAELSGLHEKASQRAAFQTLDALGLLSLSGKRLGHLQTAERRALLVAHALLTRPSVLCLEQPLAGLDTAAQQLLLAVIERAARERRLIVAHGASATSAAERELAASCNEHLRLSAGVAVSEAHEQPRSRVTATVCRNHHAFAEALAERGLRAHPTHEAGILDVLTSPHAGPAWRYLVELTDGSTGGVLDAALQTDAGLLELLPVD